MQGSTLGKYQIVERIGVGGMATVYRAFDTSTERFVALKILHEQYSSDPSLQERFRREARAIAQLDHQNILPLYEFDEKDGVSYLVMPLMKSGTLAQYIADHRPLPFDQASHFLTQVADALDHAHGEGIIHRDIKPSNILLDRKNTAYLTDFGLAKPIEGLSKLTVEGAILGTPPYMSPEQCRGDTKLTFASDIYSLGIVLYEMLTGRVPFEAETGLAVLHMHLNKPLPPPRQFRTEITDAMQAVILKALTMETESRYSSCGDMANAFAQAVSEYEQRKKEDEEAERKTVIVEKDTPPPPPRIPKWVIAGVIGLIIVVGILAINSGILSPVTATPTATDTLPATEPPAPSVMPSVTEPPTAPTATDTLPATEPPAPSAMPSATEPPTVAVAPTPLLIVGNEGGTVYAIPGIATELIGFAQPYEELTISGISVNGDYYRVDYNAQVGWIEVDAIAEVQGDLSAVPVVNPAEDNAPTASVIGVVSGNEHIVRSLPGVFGERLGDVNRGDQLLITGINQSRDYYRVEYNGQAGWLSVAYIGEAQGDLTAVPVVGSGVIGTVSGTDRVIRSLPGVFGERLGVVNRGDQLLITGINQSRDYYRVEYNGQTGWFSVAYIGETQGDLTAIPIVTP